MTELDKQVVAENAHFTHYLFDLLRLIEEGVPVVQFIDIGSDTAKVEKRIAEEVLRLVRKRENPKCKYNHGDVLRCTKGYDYELGRRWVYFRDYDFNDNGTLYNSCLLVDADNADEMVTTTDIINENYIKDEDYKD